MYTYSYAQIHDYTYEAQEKLKAPGSKERGSTVGVFCASRFRTLKHLGYYVNRRRDTFR